MADDQQVTPRRTAKRDSRSRKGCPGCRSRKIKCDEQKPECGQCLKTGRVCRIIDSMFKPHSYSLDAKPASTPHHQHDSPYVDSTAEKSGPFAESHHGVDRGLQAAPETRAQEKPIDSPRQDVTTPEQAVQVKSTINQDPAKDGTVQVGHRQVSRTDCIESPRQSEENSDDSYQDRCEIAFFLRHFSEGPGQWMDLLGSQSYFSQNIVQLAHWSPLVRYAACALGAKQLGQTRNPAAQIRQTNTQRLMMQALIDTRLGFTWYGAKYYEKAIQLLAKQISNTDRMSCSLSPNFIYGTGQTPQSGESNPAEGDTSPYQILAACILCQYEDVNATLRAWSGHLDGVYRLLRSHLPDSRIFRVAKIPQATRALDATFWFFVLNDMLNGFVTKRKARINADDLSLWRSMGLPLDDHGHLVTDLPHETQLDTVLYKGLIRLMCHLVNSDLRDPGQWNKLNDEFDRWQNAVPPSFYIPIAWPPIEPSPSHSIDPFTRELWFASDISAVTIAFYHMSRMVLLASRPMELFMRQSGETDDLLSSYNTLQQDLRKHAMEVIPIMHAMPNESVQKHMLQPLYVAGRSLTDDKERKSLLHLLRDMGDEFGLFTDYRMQELCEEWGMPCDIIDRKDGHGILT